MKKRSRDQGLTGRSAGRSRRAFVARASVSIVALVTACSVDIGEPHTDGATVAPYAFADGNDSDLDGVLDSADNCVDTPNADQRDSDGDGLGNVCDGDLNNDCNVNYSDLSAFGAVFLTSDVNADINGDGVVNFSDLSLLGGLMFQAPGPSGAPNICDQTLANALEQHMPLTLKASCSGIPASVDMLPCASYSVQYDDYFNNYNVVGPSSAGGSMQEDTSPSPIGPEPHTGAINFKGTILEMDGLGNVRVAGDATVIAVLYVNRFAQALENGMPVVYVPDQAGGAFDSTDAHTIRYSRTEGKITVVGLANGAVGVSSSLSGRPATETLVMRDEAFRFDQAGRVTNAAGEDVGSLSLGEFEPQVFEPGDDIYIETKIESTELCHSHPVGWNAPKSYPASELQSSRVSTPIQWSSFQSEVQLHGYNPKFNPGRVGFGANGRPLIRDDDLNLQVLTDSGNWKTISLRAVARESLKRQGIGWREYPGSGPASLFRSGPGNEQRVVFDDACHAYTVIDMSGALTHEATGATIDLMTVLMHSYDGGHSWAAYPLTDWYRPDLQRSYGVAVDMEVPTKGSTLRLPPAIAVHRLSAEHTLEDDFELAIYVPEKNDDDTLTVGDLHTVAHDSITVGNHSGVESYIVSTHNEASGEDLVHIVYPAQDYVVDPFGTGRPGTGQYGVTFSRTTKEIVMEPVLLGVGLNGPNIAADDNDSPAESTVDPHNVPALAQDSEGYLHMVSGGHAARMQYRQSLSPYSMHAWTEPVDIGEQPNVDGATSYADEYSYPSLVFDQYDRPHVVARWSGLDYAFELVHLYRGIDGVWSEQETLAHPGRLFYGVWYHKLSVDNWGRLFLSYSYTPGNLFLGEASQFEDVWSLNDLQRTDAACEPTATAYCDYDDVPDVSPAILFHSSWTGAGFELTTSETFFRGL